MKDKVILSRQAMKDLKKLPKHIALKLKAWVELVETNGLVRARRVPGFHDEPLLGKRLGQRSIRLSLSYRAIYTIEGDSGLVSILVLEVNKHDY